MFGHHRGNHSYALVDDPLNTTPDALYKSSGRWDEVRALGR